MSTVLFLRSHIRFFLFLDWWYVLPEYLQVNVKLSVVVAPCELKFVSNTSFLTTFRWAEGDWKNHHSKWWEIFCWADEEVHTFDLWYILCCLRNTCRFWSRLGLPLSISKSLRYMDWLHNFFPSFSCKAHRHVLSFMIICEQIHLFAIVRIHEYLCEQIHLFAIHLKIASLSNAKRTYNMCSYQMVKARTYW